MFKIETHKEGWEAVFHTEFHDTLEGAENALTECLATDAANGYSTYSYKVFQQSGWQEVTWQPGKTTINAV